MLDLVGLKVPDLDDRPCKICLRHSRWHFYGKMDVIYGFNLTFLEEYDRVNNLRNNTKLDAAYQALKRVDPARRMTMPTIPTPARRMSANVLKSLVLRSSS